MSIENLVYFYIIVSIAMILFNVSYLLFHRFYLNYQKYVTNTYQKRISKQIKHLKEQQALTKYHLKWLSYELIFTHRLVCFHEAVCYERVADSEAVEQYLQASHALFVKLGRKYRKGSDERKAYFAYLLSCYRLEEGYESSELINLMIEFTLSSNIYCRENALKALYSFGNCEAVVQAIKAMSHFNIKHHRKLLTDGLVTFQGNQNQLSHQLFLSYSELTIEYRVAIIDYMRFIKANFQEACLAILTSPKVDKEEKLATIRYFRKIRDERAYKILLEYVTNFNSYDFEYVALAALALENYPTQEAFAALKGSLSSSNWHIRLNAADTLKKYGVSYFDALDIFYGDDRYAREMLKYRITNGKGG